jgi:hypothetical protein
MKSSNDIIIKYLKKKGKFIKALTNGRVKDFCTAEDVWDVRQWSAYNANRVLNELVPSLGRWGCPWCIKFGYMIGYNIKEPYCPLCSYGERHGECRLNNTDNTFGRIMANYDGVEMPDKTKQELRRILCGD